MHTPGHNSKYIMFNYTLYFKNIQDSTFLVSPSVICRHDLPLCSLLCLLFGNVNSLNGHVESFHRQATLPYDLLANSSNFMIPLPLPALMIGWLSG